MSEKSTLRLIVLRVLMASLLVTLVGRLFYMQVVTGASYQSAAIGLRTHPILTPAVRGLILDDAGRALVSNRTSLVISVDRTTMLSKKLHGPAILTRLARALSTTYAALYDRLQLCGTKGAKKPPICWNGSPYQPIPIAKDVTPKLALQIMEHRADFPGVSADVETIRAYPAPYGVNAAHILGYLGPVTQSELTAQANQKLPAASQLQRTDLVGRSGLESKYDTLLRGFPGLKKVIVNRAGIVTGIASTTAATPGDYLVTNIDARLQAVVEQQLLAAIYRGRSQSDKTGVHFKADSGAAVVLDVKTGAVLAMASYPTYDPNLWVGGITTAELKQLLDPANGEPLTSRAMQGGYPPGSTFKISSAAAALKAGISETDAIPCPSSLQIGNRYFSNFESESYGPIPLSQAIVVSCDTVFYKIAYDNWLRDGGNHPIAHPNDYLINMSLAFGFGRKTGIDLPSESSGRIETRALLASTYKNMKDIYCSRAKNGYPEVAKTDPTRAAYLKAVASDNCANGALYRGGDAVNFAIGQGGTLATPLQLAVAFSAVANGGTLYAPQVGKGALKSDGSVAAIFAPKVVGHLPITAGQIGYLQSAMRGVVTSGTASGVFSNFPLGTIPVAGKTGTAQMPGTMQPTSWFASFAPADNPQYAVVVMVSQGDTGAGTSAPSVRGIYEALFGVTGMSVNPKNAIFPLGHPIAALPKISGTGVSEIAPGANPTGSASPSPSSGLVAVPFLGLVGWLARLRRRRVVPS